MIELTTRPGSVEDEPEVLALFDEAISWLVQRGLVGQWGEQPFSASADARALVRRTLKQQVVQIADHDGAVVGALAAGTCPPYVPSIQVPELYVWLLISARRLSGNRIGSRLLRLATEIARARGAQIVRVDCWADSPGLVTYYERQGFTREGRFDLDGWRGQILSRRVV